MLKFRPKNHPTPHAFLLLLLLLLSACRSEQPPPLSTPPPLPEAKQPSLSTPNIIQQASAIPGLTPSPTATPPAATESAGEGAAVLQSPSTGNNVPSDLDGLLSARPLDSNGIVLRMWHGLPVGYWHYAATVPFYDLREAITLKELRALWDGAGPLIVSAQTKQVFQIKWDEPAETVEVLNDKEIAARIWQRDGSVALVPFDLLEPGMKALTMDNLHLLDPNIDPEAWPLAVPVGINGDIATAQRFEQQFSTPLSNRNPDRMTSVAITGVTALVRATAFGMEQNGILWPGEEVREVLRSADIAHISNEVAFVPDCPYPNPVGGTRFCSDFRYFELLQDIGTDVMELTGNHVNDYGAAHFATSINLYKEAGMQVYGGGVDSSAAQEPAVFEHNGNHIVFHGCNSFGPSGAWAADGYAGSRSCDESLLAQIAADSAESVIITTLQYTEFYQYTVPWQQQVDFRAYADAGADIISGSQGHHLQAFELYKDSVIHYGPGNLFFDQMNMPGTRQSFVDEYLIYNGRVLGLRLHTFLIEDFARPRLMTTEERNAVLGTLFAVSISDK